MNDFYTALIAELQSGDYGGMTDAEAAAAINALTQPARQLVPLWRVKQFCIESSAWLAILQAAQSHENEQVRGAAALTAIYVDDSRFANLDLDLPSTQQMLGGLVAGGVVTQELAAAVDALANTTTSRAAILGLGTVGDGHVLSARRMF